MVSGDLATLRSDNVLEAQVIRWFDATALRMRRFFIECRDPVLMKFECVKFSGKVDNVSFVRPMRGGYKVTLKIDGEVIPNLVIPGKLYEELETNKNVTLYGLFKNSRKKEKNDGVLYGMKPEGGERMFATNMRLGVPALLAFYACLAFCVMFVVGWAASLALVAGFSSEYNPGAMMHTTTVFALVEASLAGLFFLWRAWVIFSKTSNPEAWETITPAVLSSRFSKFHKS